MHDPHARLSPLALLLVLATCQSDEASGDDPGSTSAADSGAGTSTSTSTSDPGSTSGGSPPDTGTDSTSGFADDSGSTSTAVASTSTDDASSDGSGTGEAVCELDPIGAASGTPQEAWALGADATTVDLAVDSLGNVVIVGRVQSADFGGEIVDAGEEVSFAAKYDSGGALSWVEVFAAPTPDTISVAIDDADDVRVAGSFEAGKILALDGGTGDTMWASSAGAGFYAEHVATLPGGDAVFLENATSPVTSSVVRVAGVDGAQLWSRPIGQNLAFGDFTWGRALAVAGEQVVWAGRFAGMIATPGGNVSSASEETTFAVVTLDEDGDPVWAYAAGAPVVVELEDVGADPCGGVYVYGWLQGSMDIGLDEDLLGFEDPFVIRIDPAGDPQWAVQLPVVGTAHLGDIAVDGEGNVLVTGRADNVDFGAGVVQVENASGFFARIDRDANLQWGHLFETTFLAQSVAAAFDGQGNAWVVGWFDGEVNIAGTIVAAAPGYATFAARFAP